MIYYRCCSDCLHTMYMVPSVTLLACYRPTGRASVVRSWVGTLDSLTVVRSWHVDFNIYVTPDCVSVTCLDVDECQLQPCSQLCINTAGSYHCDCVAGYQLRPDGHTCKALGRFTTASIWSLMSVTYYTAIEIAPPSVCLSVCPSVCDTRQLCMQLCVHNGLFQESVHST